jgi:hypothetical protein
MEWVKRRVFQFQKEYLCHTELDHVIFFRLRSDGTMWYQVSRLSMADMIHRLPGGWLHDKWKRFVSEETDAPKYTSEEFDKEFEALMISRHGVEVELLIKNE